MKINPVIIGLIISCILILSNGQNQQTCCETKDIIRVTGTGENKIQPDMAIIYAFLNEQGSTAQDALSSIEPILSNLTTNLQAFGDNATQIMTSAISIYPKYSYINMTNTISGYIVYVSLTVTIYGIETDTRRIARVMDSLAVAGVTSINGITYDSIDPNAGKTVARTNAYDDAAGKARLYAQLASRSLGKITLIEQTSISYSPYYYSSSGITSQYYPTTSFSSQETSANTGSTGGNTSNDVPQLPIGTILISATVFISWQLS